MSKRPTLTRRALSDKKVREIAADAGADISRGVETVLRQSRRVNAKYNKLHVHVGNPGADDYVGAPASKAPETREVPTLTEYEWRALCAAMERNPNEISAAVAAVRQLVEQREKIERRGDANAKREQRASGYERHMWRDSKAATETPGDDDAHDVRDDKKPLTRETDDSDDSELSAREILAGTGGPPPGRHYRRTERESRGALSSQIKRDRERAQLAWAAFEQDHPGEAGEIAKVWVRVGQQILQDAVAFARAVASFVKRQVRTQQGRSRREGDLVEYWRKWRGYLKQWARNNPDLQLPATPSERAEPVYTPAFEPVSDAVAVAIYGPRQAPQPSLPSVIAAPQDDPLARRWIAEGMPLRPGSIFRLKPLPAYQLPLAPLGIGEDATDRAADLRSRVAENNARRDYWNLFNRVKPRSFMPP